ncbi:MAG TPA: zf-HC2 domain-containing protein [Gaiellaceae bacterium]|jgi:putative zinc finger protein|nr:zf-HC2 domain-containing protein [Gaiellaceae bacterium]
MSERTAELTCAELVELVTEYLEEALPGEELERFEEHLVYCSPCVTHVDQMRETIRTTGALREQDLDPGLADELLAAFRGWRGSPA